MSLEVIRRGETCELRLAAPPGNVIDKALCLALTNAVREEARDPRLKAFLLTATGKHFSYGASVPEHVRGEVEQFLPAFRGLFEAFMEASVPIVAAVSGMCLGGAFELAAFAHFLVADQTAVFGVPEIQLGVIPPPACAILPWRLGGAVAEDLILSGRRLPAAEAVRCGLVTVLCEAGGLQAATERLLDDAIRPRSAAVLRQCVKAVRGPLHAELERRLPELERCYLEELMALADANEGIAAFLEKRDPEWVDA